MKIDFTYQRFYLRIGICGVLVLGWIVASQFIAGLFRTPWVYWVVSAAVTVGMMALFYKLSENASLFYKTGHFEKTETGYRLTRRKTYELKDVKRICAWKSNLYGTKSWFLQIEAEKKIKVVSKPVRKDQEFESVDLYQIFQQILKDNPDLKEETNKDGTAIPYFYSK